MDFCPNCETRLAQIRKKRGKNVTVQLVCQKCGYKKQGEATLAPPEIKKQFSQEPIAVIGRKEQKLRTLPTVRIECPRCSNNMAYVWQVQTRGSDESSTQFFRCTKCNYTFREYG